MFRSAKELIGYRVNIGNQCIGVVADLLLNNYIESLSCFEVISADSNWTTRFLVNPLVVRAPNWIDGILPLGNIPEQVEIPSGSCDEHLTAMSFLLGQKCVGMDDAVGQVYDFLFTTENWGIKYCIVDISKYHFRRIIVPMSLVRIEYNESVIIHVKLSKKQVFEGVSLDPTQPVDRQIRNFPM